MIRMVRLRMRIGQIRHRYRSGPFLILAVAVSWRGEDLLQIFGEFLNQFQDLGVDGNGKDCICGVEVPIPVGIPQLYAYPRGLVERFALVSGRL